MSEMGLTVDELIGWLDDVARKLTATSRLKLFESDRDFEFAVYELLLEKAAERNIPVRYVPGSQGFPDIVVGSSFGIEVKFKQKDAWKEVANSVFEGSRIPEVQDIFIIFGKMGGIPEVRVRRYEDAIVHVRTSHMPRFSISMDTTDSSLFHKAEGIPVSYEEFRQLNDREKMHLLRLYARRKHNDAWLWWVESESEALVSLDPIIRDWTDLTKEEKRKYVAEAVILCPEVLMPGRGGSGRIKTDVYKKVRNYLLTVYGISCGNVRDILSAGSMAQPCPDGNYARCTLRHIEAHLIAAISDLDERRLREYWGCDVHYTERIDYWLNQADKFAVGWKPSQELIVLAKSDTLISKIKEQE